MCHQSGLTQPDLSVTTVTEDLDQLASAHSKIEKAVSDLSYKIEALQIQENKQNFKAYYAYHSLIILVVHYYACIIFQ